MMNLLSLLLLLLPAPASAAAPGKERTTITVIYTGNADGNLESCDCPGNPYGGLARRIAVLKELTAAHHGAIVVDAGDFCPSRRDPLLARYCFELVQRCNYDLVAIGDQELYYGAAYLKESGIASLSAGNLRPSSTGEALPFSDTPLIKDTGGIKTAVISVISPCTLSSLTGEGSAAAFKAADPVAFLKETVPGLRKKADIVILVAHVEADAVRKIAADVPGIDVIVAGHVPQFLNVPLRAGSSLIVQPGLHGQRVGVLSLTVKNRKIVSQSNRLILLTKDIKDEPAARATIDAYKKELKQRAIRLLE